MSLDVVRGLPVETKRLLIRPMQTEDAAFILELLNDPSFLANIGDKGVRNLDDALGYIQSAGWDNYERLGFGMFTVELVDAAARIGICGLLKRDWLDDPDVGFALLQPYGGKGYATESALAVIAWARQEHGVTTIKGITSASNAASINVLGKCGLSFERSVQLVPDAEPISVFG